MHLYLVVWCTVMYPICRQNHNLGIIRHPLVLLIKWSRRLQARKATQSPALMGLVVVAQQLLTAMEVSEDSQELGQEVNI